MTGQAVSMVLALGVIVALILALAFFVRRLQGIRPQQGSGIELVTTRMLGPKERLVLVQVADQQILVGLNPSSMTALATFPATEHGFEAELKAATNKAGAAA